MGVDARQGFVQVQPGRGGRALGVAVGDGAGNGSVLGGAAGETVVIVASEAAHAGEVHTRALDRRREVPAAAETLVESLVELGDEGVVAVSLGVVGGECPAIDGGETLGELGEPDPHRIATRPSPASSLPHSPRGEACGLLVEGGAQLEKRGDIVGLDIAHHQSAGSALGREPGGDEASEGFAHRGATDSEPTGLLNLGESRAGGQLALDDRRPEGVERSIGRSTHAPNVYIACSWR